MRTAVDYYAVLGVPRDVGPEDLKRRYRQLVRQHHPDVADDPEAAQERFILLVEAYRVLADPARRRAYDTLQSTAPPPTQTRSVQIQRQIDDWLRHAVHEFEQGDLGGAAAQCRKVLAIDPRHGAAQALLGDVHFAREEWDQALVLYSGAVSAAPRNAVYARKLRAAAEGGQRARATEERRVHLADQRRRAIEALNARHEFLPYAALLLLAWIVIMLVWVGRHPGEPVCGWLPLPANVALTSAGGGLLLGIVLACLGWGRDRAETTGARLARLGLALLALVLFWLSTAAFCLWSAPRRRLAGALTAGYLLSVGWVIALTALAATGPAPEAWRAVLLLAGNVVFPCVLLGQDLGRAGLRLPG